MSVPLLVMFPHPDGKGVVQLPVTEPMMAWMWVGLFRKSSTTFKAIVERNDVEELNVIARDAYLQAGKYEQP